MEENNPTQTPPQFTPNNSVSTPPKKFNRKVLVLLGIIIFLGLTFAGFKYNQDSDHYLTYTECVEKTSVPCRFIFVGDFVQAWIPSTFKSKEECESTESIIGYECVIPSGNFKEIRWINSANLKRVEDKQKNPSYNSDLTNYTNREYGFEIKHPTGWWPVQQSENLVVIYGPDADQSSMSIKYYPNINSLPLNPTTNKPYEYFDQYVMDSRLFSNQKNIPLGSGMAKSANLAQDPSYKVLLVGGNGHFYEIIYMPRYDQTLSQLEEIVSTFNFVSSSDLNPTASIIEILPSGSTFLQGEGADIPISWKVSENPVDTKTYLRLLSQDGKEVLGSITNGENCSSGGDASNLSSLINTFKWDGLVVCSNWQAHKVPPGSYRIGVQIYYGNDMTASGNSISPFIIK